MSTAILRRRVVQSRATLLVAAHARPTSDWSRAMKPAHVALSVEGDGRPRPFSAASRMALTASSTTAGRSRRSWKGEQLDRLMAARLPDLMDGAAIFVGEARIESALEGAANGLDIAVAVRSLFGRESVAAASGKDRGYPVVSLAGCPR
jgi:hypothetical protein